MTPNDLQPIEQGPAEADSKRPGSCCVWMAWLRPSYVAVGVLASLTVLATLAAVFFAGVASEARSASQSPVPHFSSGSGLSSGLGRYTLDDLPVAHAAAAVTSERFSMAIGPVSDQSEGLFVLDHNSGLLQCSVIYPRLGQFLATFSVNVAETLGTQAKGGGYMMATGIADFPRNSSRPVGMSVIYVLDTTTGVYGCYGVPFDRIAMNANRPQQGSLVMIGQGSANPVIDREDLR
ncbi:MAG: hypothetical protein AAGD07_01095 [Planctomycetota bacterium]